MSDSLDILNIGYYDLVKKYRASKPSEVSGIANTSAAYYFNWMLRKIFGNFEIEGAPDDWDINYVKLHLFLDGFFTITDTGLGVLPLKCSITGINVFERPTKVIIANNVLGNLERTIDKDCALITLQYNFRGIRESLERYAYMLSSCDSSIDVNLMNSKVAFIAEVGNRQEAQTFKKMYDEIAMGKPATFYKKTNKDSNFTLMNVKNTYIADTILDTKEKIINEFLTEYGINNANQIKKEREIVAEAESNNDECRINVEHFLKTVNDGLEKANNMFGLNLKFKINEANQTLNVSEAPGKEETENGNS